MSDGPFLTQAEVDALRTGSLVEITWSGGNGPHVYEVYNHFGFADALCNPPDMRNVVDARHPIDFVGPCRPHTVVKLVAIYAGSC